MALTVSPDSPSHGDSYSQENFSNNLQSCGSVQRREIKQQAQAVKKAEASSRKKARGKVGPLPALLTSRATLTLFDSLLKGVASARGTLRVRSVPLLPLVCCAFVSSVLPVQTKRAAAVAASHAWSDQIPKSIGPGSLRTPACSEAKDSH